MVEEIEPRVIKILGDGKEHNGSIEKHKEFYCNGQRNIEGVCGNCKLRYQCFSTRDPIEIPVNEFGKKSIRDVTVRMVANKISNLKYKFKKGKGWEENDRVQINFKKVLLK